MGGAASPACPPRRRSPVSSAVDAKTACENAGGNCTTIFDGLPLVTAASVVIGVVWLLFWWNKAAELQKKPRESWLAFPARRKRKSKPTGRKGKRGKAAAAAVVPEADTVAEDEAGGAGEGGGLLSDYEGDV